MTLLPINLGDLNGFSAKADKINATHCLRYVARRYLVFGVTSFVLVTFLLRRLYFHEVIVENPLAGQEHESSRWPGLRLPPLFSQYHEHELALPQHHWHAASHEGEPKFLFIPGHNRGTICSLPHVNAASLTLFYYIGSGWGNIWQEILLNAYLAHKSNRAYVPGSP